MVFLNPSILLALLAASIPILIHILNFRKLKKVEFSTLSFLKELQKSKIRKIKLKQWLLLLLRTLIIIIIVLAFGRPTLENVSLAGATSAAKSSMVFIIDNSFSMDLIGSDGSNFNKSKMIAKDIISKMQNGDEIIIFHSQDSSFITSNKESAIINIDNLEISLITEPVSNKLKNAIEILDISNNINKEIYIFTDLQVSTFKETKEINAANDILSAKNIKLYSFDMSNEKSNNYSVNNLRLENSIVELNKPLNFSALVNNYSDSEVNNITASLFVNERRVAQQSISLKNREEKRIYFETEVSNSGIIEVKVELESDNLIQDNISYLSFIIPDEIKLILLYDDIRDLKFIETALTTISEQILVSKHKIDKTLNEKLSDFDVVFYLGNSINNTLKVDEYLQQGGNLIFIPTNLSNESSLEEISQLINLPKANRLINTDPRQQNYSEFGDIDFDHPVFLNLFEKDKNQIESANFYKYIKFEELNYVNPVIRLIDNSIFIGEYGFDKGKVVFFNTAFDLSWSNFPIKGIFAPLLSRLIFYLTSSYESFNTYITGKPINIDISNITYPAIDVITPTGDDKINIQQNKKNIYTYDKTYQNGFYNFYSNNNLITTASVNTDNRESDLTKIELNELNEYYQKIFETNFLIFNFNENYLDKITKARYGTELWKYFLVIALILAFIEMYIAKSSKKDLIELTQAKE